MKLKTLTITLTLMLLMNAAGCSIFREDPNVLSRERAARLISANKQFDSIITMPINDRAVVVDQNSADDTSDAALERVRPIWSASNPALIAGETLGLFNVNFKFTRKRPTELGMKYEYFHAGFGRWEFEPQITTATDKVKALWQEFGIEPRSHEPPLVRAHFDGVTGVSTEGNAGDVHFTWHWEKTSLAKALTVDSAEFKQLPTETQKLLRNWPGTASIPSEQPRQGIANFTKFDDGWRLAGVHIL